MSGQPSAIIQQGIADMLRFNEQANEDLTTTLQDLRERVQAPYIPPHQYIGGTPPAGVDDYQYRRVLLYGSQWNSEVVAAAALDSDFKEETSQRAKAVLKAHGMLPDLPEDPTTEEPPSTEDDNAVS